MSRRVVVIGAGAIGTGCAHYLAKSGCEVVLIDSDAQGKGATSGNCGNLVYSHLLPLSEPGAVTRALKAIGRGDSPLYIKPRFDPALWRWLLQFALQCNEESMLRSSRALQPIMVSSAKLYDDLMAESPLDCEWEQNGSLYVYETEKGMEEYAEMDQLLANEFGLSATRYDANVLLELEPKLLPGSAAGGWVYDDDVQVRPEKLMSSWREVLEAQGVTIREHCGAKGILRENGVACAVRTEGEDIKADSVVVATGAWTPLLNKELGCRVPVQPGKGYSITMPRPEQCPKNLLLFMEDSVVVTPMQSGYRLGSTMEFSGYDPTLNRRRLDRLMHVAAKYLVEPHGPSITEEWFGWRPMTYDGVPIIDQSPAMRNVVIATGHNMIGLTLATGTGKLVAEMVLGEEPHLDPTPYSLSRF